MTVEKVNTMKQVVIRMLCPVSDGGYEVVRKGETHCSREMESEWFVPLCNGTVIDPGGAAVTGLISSYQTRTPHSARGMATGAGVESHGSKLVLKKGWLKVV
jgi:hypothetical protein